MILTTKSENTGHLHVKKPHSVWRLDNLGKRRRKRYNDSELHIAAFFFFLVSCGGVRLSPLGTLATNWPIVAVPGDR
jgi:hypothetical protein